MPRDLWLQGALVLPDCIVEHGLLQVAPDGKIAGLWDLTREAAPPHDPGSVIHGDYICPGFFDLHVHGGGGADFMDGDPEAAATIAVTHAQYGTTSLLATTLTAPEEAIIKAIRAAKAAPRRGARIEGFHIEGPFVNERWRGAQDARYLRLPSIAEIDRWFGSAGPGDRFHVTLAPELDPAGAAIRHLAARGAVVSAGHTDCTYAQMAAARAAGLVHVTHLFNGMRGLHHREPGAVGGALQIPGLTVELIADGIHVHPAVMALAVQARGAGDVMLVTDAMRAAGLGDGEYRLGELPVTVRGGEARLHGGSLAGSVLTMDAAVRNMVRLVGIDLPTAVAMASLHPARRHGLAGRLGSLAVGKAADVVVLDKDLQATVTLVDGQVAFDGR